MLKLIRNARVLAPDPLGVKDLLIAGGRIAAITDPGSLRIAGVAVDEMDVEGRWVLPGLVDCHVHLLGGGGEGGPATRAPEIRVEEIVSSGVTSVIGCLGTDGVTRHASSLLAKARALAQEGISARMLVGSYELPVKTLTGSVRSDLVVVEEIVGAGEIAVSDHRSAQPTFDELARLAAECHVGGLLGGKAGVLHLHVGGGSRRLELVRRLVEETEIPPSQVTATHCNRSPELLDEALELARTGVSVDLTAGLEAHGGGVAVVDALRLAVDRGVRLDRITVSSDANGSLPEFDDSGRLVRMGVGSQETLLASLSEVVGSGLLPLDQACRPYTCNPAGVYRLVGKGRLEVGSDADLLVLDADLRLTDVVARGRTAVAGGEAVLRGTFSGPAKGA